MASGKEQLIDQFTEIRTSTEAHVSDKVNKLNELMAAYENIDALKDVHKELMEVLKEFQIVHEAYHSLIKNEAEQEESTRYYNSVLEIVTELEKEISLWITRQKPPSSLADQNDNVHPEDSISSVESRTPYHPRSAVSVSRSSASSKARSPARKAALEARAAMLQSLYQLQLEKLKLQQKRAEVELQAEIEIEAKRKVYEEEEASKAGRSGLRQHKMEQLNQSNQLPRQMKDAFIPLERDTINLPGPEASKRKPIKSTPKPLERNSEYPLVPETPEWRHGGSTVGKTTRCNF